MSPARARSWRAFGAFAIWTGAITAVVLTLFIMFSALGELGSSDCGTACQEREATAAKRRDWMETLAYGGAMLAIAGIIIRKSILKPDR